MKVRDAETGGECGRVSQARCPGKVGRCSRQFCSCLEKNKGQSVHAKSPDDTGSQLPSTWRNPWTPCSLHFTEEIIVAAMV